MSCTAAETEAIKAILGNWERLSAGDISTLHGTFGRPDAHLMTTEGSPNFVLWDNLERLGWARRVHPALPPEAAALLPAFFAPTPLGRERLPDFLEYYDLRPGTFYHSSEDPPLDPAELDRLLDRIASDYADRHPHRGFTPEATAMLRRLDMDSVVLALALFAYDARHAVAAFDALLGRGESDEAWREYATLKGRIRSNWAFAKVGLPAGSADLHALAAPLAIGLGEELGDWLYAERPSPVRCASWLSRFGKRIDGFCDHVAARRRYSDPSMTLGDPSQG